MIFKFLSQNSLFVLITISLFFFSTFFGFLLYELSPEISKNLIMRLREKYAPLIEKIREFPAEAALLIFLNNLFVSIIAIFGGFILILPPIIVFSNGLLLGLIISYSLETSKPIFLLLPHGIFELPAFFLASTLGLKISTILFEKKKKRKAQLKKFFEALPSMLLLITILLMIAAAIEAALGHIISKKPL